MTIEFQDHRSDTDSITFGELQLGQAFQCLYKHGDIFVKTLDTGSSGEGVDLNCISSGYDFKVSFTNSTRVYPISILISIQAY